MGGWAPPAQAWLLGICSQHSFRSEEAEAPEVVQEVTGGDVPSVGLWRALEPWTVSAPPQSSLPWVKSLI